MIPRFRAWDNTNQEMVDVVSMNWNYPSGIEVNGSNNNRLTDSLMLYTGVKDKNGKLVCEGDIMHWSHVIAFYAKRGEIKEDTYAEIVYTGTGFTLHRIGGNRLHTLDMEYGNVIGNIYEPPDIEGLFVEGD